MRRHRTKLRKRELEQIVSKDNVDKLPLDQWIRVLDATQFHDAISSFGMSKNLTQSEAWPAASSINMSCPVEREILSVWSRQPKRSLDQLSNTITCYRILGWFLIFRSH